MNDSIDTRTAAGRLVLNVLITVAQWERRRLARDEKGPSARINNRQRVGKVRFGFDLAPDGIALVENPAEQQTLACMRSLRVAGSRFSRSRPN